MSDKRKATLLLIVWLVAYALIGGVAWVGAGALLQRASLDGLTAITISAALAIGVGWVGASWVERRVAAIADEPAVDSG